jgi:signal transduction histidine kinase
MFSVRRIKELGSTLRFRIVLWITFVVAIMVVGLNTGVREIEHRTLRAGYDDYLTDTVEQIGALVASTPTEETNQLINLLKDKAKDNEYRSLFLQVFDERQTLIWGSANANVSIPAPTFTTVFNGPFDGRRHRVLEKRLHKATGEIVYLRCGFLQLALQEDIDLINRNILLASIFLVLLAPMGGYVISWRATRPIAQIIQTAAHLEPSNLQERLPIRGTGDEVDQLSQTINGMLDRLAAFITQNRDFLANAAHELRSPLAAIRSSVEVGLNQGRSAEEYTAILLDVMEEITRLAGLINRLLTLAEADAGRLAGRNQVVRLEKLVNEAVLMFDAVADARGVKLLTGKLEPALVSGGDSSLRQVVRNLIDNAIKYNRDDGEVIVELHTDDKRQLAVLIVRDTGIGIDEDVLPRVFERFYRADKARSREQERGGYGLGLSICKTIVDALHGGITVTSEKGKGSVFTVQLPLAEEAAAPSQSGVFRHGMGPAIQEHASNAAAAPE